jgi:subtilisin-like proprotein convertase family protein
MAAAIYNFNIEQGSDFILSFQYNDENNIPVNLNGKCVVLRWTQNDGGGKIFSTSVPASLENEDSGYLLTANSQGTITFQISAQKTKLYSFSSATYDLDIIETEGTLKKNTRLSTGNVGVIQRNFDVITDCSTLNLNPDIPPSTPIVTATTGITPTPTATSLANEDLCMPEDCLDLDIYSVVYSGSGLNIVDNSNNSGTINVSDNRLIENIEIAINGLSHPSPQDLTFLLAPPSGDTVLLSSNTKITNYQSNFSFMFSNKAIGDRYLNTVSHGGLCNIYDKTNTTKFNNSTLVSSFSNLFNYSNVGNWTLYANDNDIGASGSISSWKLIITYLPAG